MQFLIGPFFFDQFPTVIAVYSACYICVFTRLLFLYKLSSVLLLQEPVERFSQRFVCLLCFSRVRREKVQHHNSAHRSSLQSKVSGPKQILTLCARFQTFLYGLIMPKFKHPCTLCSECQAWLCVCWNYVLGE